MLPLPENWDYTVKGLAQLRKTGLTPIYVNAYKNGNLPLEVQ